MTLKTPSDDGTILVVYKPLVDGSTNPFGSIDLIENVVGYQGSQDLTTVHLTDGSTKECRDVLFIRTWREKIDDTLER